MLKSNCPSPPVINKLFKKAYLIISKLSACTIFHIEDKSYNDWNFSMALCISSLQQTITLSPVFNLKM